MKVKVAILSLVIGVLACGMVWAAAPKEVHLGNFDATAAPAKVTKADVSKARLATHEPALRLHKPQVNRAEATRAAVDMIVDDGTIETNVGYGGAGADHFMFFNRFTPGVGEFPFALTQVQVWWDSGQVAIGDAYRIVVLADTDGDGDLSNATVVYEEPFTIAATDVWDTYNLVAPQLLSGPGDVCIGIAQDTDSAYPGAFDQTASQGRSYVADWALDCTTGPFYCPTPITWPPACTLATIDSLGLPGNWMIRGIGTTPPPPVMALGTVSFDDACPYGMADDDGYADPGETITFYAQIRNIGFADATNVVATLTSSYPFAITSGTASLGTIGMGGSATAVFTFNVPLAATCGLLEDLDINVTADQDPTLWNLVSPFRIGEYYEGATVNIFTEKFETWPLPGWTIVSNGPTWFQGSTGYWANWVGTGDFAEIDTFQVDFVSGSSTLTSPAFDIDGAYGTANLQYKTQFYDYYGTEDSYVDITTDGGATWSHLQTFHDEDFVGVGGPQNVSLNAYIGMTGLQVRFLANSPDYYTIWEIDDLTINGKYPDTCYSEGCVPPFTINILTPIDGRDLYGITEVCAQVTDPAIVDHVNWYVDGVAIVGCQDLTTLPYCCMFDPQMYGIGAHTLRAEAVLLSADSVWSAPVTFYTVGTVMAFPDAFPPSGIVPLTVLFTSNAVWGSGQYVFDWWVPTPSGTGGMTYNTTGPTQEITFNTAGDYLVTLFVTDTMGTDDVKDDMVIVLPAIKITAVQLAVPTTPNTNRHASMVGAM